MNKIDRSDEADGRRFKLLLDGNGYFLEEEMLCGHYLDDKEKDRARQAIDKAMAEQLHIAALPAQKAPFGTFAEQADRFVQSVDRFSGLVP